MQYNADTNIYTLTLADARKIEKYTPAAYDKLADARKLKLDAYKDGVLHHSGPFSTSSFSFLKKQRWIIVPGQGLLSYWYQDYPPLGAAKIAIILSDTTVRRYHKTIQLKLA